MFIALLFWVGVFLVIFTAQGLTPGSSSSAVTSRYPTISGRGASSGSTPSPACSRRSDFCFQEIDRRLGT